MAVPSGDDSWAAIQPEDEGSFLASPDVEGMVGGNHIRAAEAVCCGSRLPSKDVQGEGNDLIRLYVVLTLCIATTRSHQRPGL